MSQDVADLIRLRDKLIEVQGLVEREGKLARVFGNRPRGLLERRPETIVSQGFSHDAGGAPVDLRGAAKPEGIGGNGGVIGSIAEGTSSAAKAFTQGVVDLGWGAMKLALPESWEPSEEYRPNMSKLFEGTGRVLSGKDFGEAPLGPGQDMGEAERGILRPTAQAIGHGAGSFAQLVAGGASARVIGHASKAAQFGIAKFAPRLAAGASKKAFLANAAIMGGAGFGAEAFIRSGGDAQETLESGLIYGPLYSVLGVVGDKVFDALVQRGVLSAVAGSVVRGTEAVVIDPASEIPSLAIMGALNEAGITRADLTRAAPVLKPSFDSWRLEQERQAILEKGEVSDKDIGRINAIDAKIAEHEKAAKHAWTEYLGQGVVMAGFGAFMRSQQPRARRENPAGARKLFDDVSRARIDEIARASTAAEPASAPAKPGAQNTGAELRPLLDGLYAAGATVNENGMVKRPAWRGWKLRDVSRGTPAVETHDGRQLEGQAAIDYVADENLRGAVANIRLRKALADPRFKEDAPGLLSFDDGQRLLDVSIGRDGQWLSRKIHESTKPAREKRRPWERFELPRRPALAGRAPESLPRFSAEQLRGLLEQAQARLEAEPNEGARRSREKIAELEDFVLQAGSEDPMTLEVAAALSHPVYRDSYADRPVSLLEDLADMVAAGEGAEALAHKLDAREIEKADVQGAAQRDAENRKALEAQRKSESSGEEGFLRLKKGKVAEQIGEGLSLVRDVIRKYSMRGVNYAEKQFGEPGAKIREAFRRVDQRAAKGSGATRVGLLRAARKVLGDGVKKDLSNIDEKLVRDTYAYANEHLDAKQVDPKAVELVEAMRPHADAVLAATEGSGIKRAGFEDAERVGGSGRFMPQVPNDRGRTALEQASSGKGGPELNALLDAMGKMPDYADVGHAEGALNVAERRKELTRRLAEESNANRTAAKLGYLERKRMRLPLDFIETDWRKTLAPTQDKAWVRVEAAREFGGSSLPELTKLYERIEADLRAKGQGTKDLADLRDFLAFELGVRDSDKVIAWEGGSKAIRNAGILATIAGKLGTTLLNSTQVPVTLIPTMGFKAVAHSYFKVPPLLHFFRPKSKAKLRAMAEAAEKRGHLNLETFISETAADGKLQDWVKLGLKISGMTHQEMVNQVRTSVAAEKFLKDALPKLQKAERGGRIGKAISRMLGNDSPEALKRRIDNFHKGVLEDGYDIDQARADAFVWSVITDTQFPKSIATKPVYYAYGEIAKTLLLYKPFMTQMLGFAHKHAFREGIKTGNFVPLAKMLASSVAAGGLAKAILDLLTDEERSWVTKSVNGAPPNEVGAAVLEALSQTGVTGPAQDIFGYGVGNFLAGPVGSKAITTVQGLAEAGIQLAHHGAEGAAGSLRETAERAFSGIGEARRIYDAMESLLSGDDSGEYVIWRNRSRDYRDNEGEINFWDRIETAVRTATGQKAQYERNADTTLKRYLAGNVTTNDPEDAKRWAELLLFDAEGGEDRKKQLRSIRASARAWSPFGKMSKEQRDEWKETLTPEEWGRAKLAQKAWSDRYYHAINDAAKEVWGRPATLYGWKKLQ